MFRGRWADEKLRLTWRRLNRSQSSSGKNRITDIPACNDDLAVGPSNLDRFARGSSNRKLAIDRVRRFGERQVFAADHSRSFWLFLAVRIQRLAQPSVLAPIDGHSVTWALVRSTCTRVMNLGGVMHKSDSIFDPYSAGLALECEQWN